MRVHERNVTFRSDFISLASPRRKILLDSLSVVTEIVTRCDDEEEYMSRYCEELSENRDDILCSGWLKR